MLFVFAVSGKRGGQTVGVVGQAAVEIGGPVAFDIRVVFAAL